MTTKDNLDVIVSRIDVLLADTLRILKGEPEDRDFDNHYSRNDMEPAEETNEQP